MYFTNKRLSDAIIAALSKTVVEYHEKTNKWLALGLPQLGRSDYNTFKKVLSEIHGKWNKKLDAHVFDENPTLLLEEVIEVGCLPERKPHDAFFTPRAVAELLFDWGDFYCFEDAEKYGFEPDKCLEPQAGQGGIVKVLQEQYPTLQIDCCEIDSYNRNILQKQGFNVIGEDFLNLEPNPIYRWVIMNPPFNGQQGDCVDHILHAFKFLEPRGRLLAIVPVGFLTSTIKRIVDFRNWVFTLGSQARLPEKAFAESGTTVDCVMLRIDNLSSEDIKRLEADDCLYDSYDWYTGSILVSLQSDYQWYKTYCKLIDRVRRKRILSKESLLEELISDADDFVQQGIRRYECDFRWDSFTKPRFAEYCYEYMVEAYFDDQDPFVEPPKQQQVLRPVWEFYPIQLSLFA